MQDAASDRAENHGDLGVLISTSEQDFPRLPRMKTTGRRFRVRPPEAPLQVPKSQKRKVGVVSFSPLDALAVRHGKRARELLNTDV